MKRRTLLAAGAAGCISYPSNSELAVPITYDEYGGLFIACAINGGAPVRMALDTGASRGLLDLAYCQRQGLALSESGDVEGSAGAVASQQTSVRLHIPGLAPFDTTLSVYAFGSYDPACIGIIGAETLSRAPLRLDYRERQLVWRARRPAITTRIVVDNNIPRVRARANGVNLDLRLDTGATLSPGATYFVNLTSSQAEAVGLTGAPRQFFSATGTGGASLQLPVHDLEEFSIADIPLTPARAIVQPMVGYFARGDAVGFLGNSVLDKINPYLDYAQGVFAFDPPSTLTPHPGL